MEDYAAGIRGLLDEFGEEIEIVHKNKLRAAKVDYIRDYYIPELIGLVNERYCCDFENFGYEFL